MAFIDKIFKKKPPKRITINNFIKDVEDKLDSLLLSDKTIGNLEKKVKDLDTALGSLSNKIQEFSKERKEMDEISNRVIELVSLIYTMDTKINNLSKQFEEIKRETLRNKPSHPKLKKRKEIGQFELELGSNNKRK